MNPSRLDMPPASADVRAVADPSPGSSRPPDPLAIDDARPDVAPSPGTADAPRGYGKLALVYGIGILLNKAVAFLMMPLYTRLLTPADYGVMELIGMTLEVISIMSGAQLAMGIFRYYHKAEDEAGRQRVVSTALLALGGCYAVVGAVSFAAAAPLASLIFGSGEHTTLIRLASIGLVVQNLLLVPLAYARVRDRSLLYVSANVVKLVIGLGLNVLLLVHFRMGVKAVFLSNVVAHVVVGTWLTVVVVREVGFGFSTAVIRDLVRYGSPMILGWLAAFLYTFGDRYFLQAAGDTTAVGLYSLAYQFGFLMAVLGCTPFMQVWEARRFQIARLPDRDARFARGFVHFNLLQVTVGVGIALYVEPMLQVMATPAFHGAAALVPVILVAYLLQGWTTMQESGLLIGERTAWTMYANWAAAAVAFAGYWLLVPRWLGWGAAIATVLAFLVRHLVTYVASQRIWPIRYDWPPVVRITALGVGAAGVGLLLPPLAFLPSVAARTLLLGAYAAGLWYLDILRDDERDVARRLVRRGAGLLLARLSRRAVST